ncbi:MAG: hypothetical protein ACP5H8_00885 [Candidatus Micrarchaeia archaeon]
MEKMKKEKIGKCVEENSPFKKKEPAVEENMRLTKEQIEKDIAVLKDPKSIVTYLMDILTIETLDPKEKKAINKLLSESYMKVGKAYEESHCYWSAAECYKRMGTKEGFMKAAEAYKKIGYYFDAVECYVKAGMQKETESCRN